MRLPRCIAGKAHVSVLWNSVTTRPFAATHPWAVYVVTIKFLEVVAALADKVLAFAYVYVWARVFMHTRDSLRGSRDLFSCCSAVMTCRDEIFISPRTNDSAPFKNSNKKNGENVLISGRCFLPTYTTAVASYDVSQSIFNVSYLFQVYYFFAAFRSR